MQKLKSFLISLLLFIGFTAIGTMIGYKIGTSRAELNREGKFTSWNVLRSSIKFNKIVYATPRAIWAQSLDGKLYSYYFFGCGDQPECNQWVEAEEIPGDILELYEKPEITVSCPKIDLKYFSPPSGNVVECTRVRSSGMDVFIPTYTVYFALMDAGEILIWEFGYSPIDGVVQTLLCTCPGFALGVGIFIMFMMYRKKKTPNTVTENNQGTTLQ